VRIRYLQFDYVRLAQFVRSRNAVLDFRIGATSAPLNVTTQAPIEPKYPVEERQPPPRVEVYWTAITYKTVVVYSILAVLLLFGGLYVITPDSYSWAYHKMSSVISSPENKNLALSQTQAKFVNLDGRVQVKKVNSVQWVNADYHTSLDKGDFIQTGADGAARIYFADGSQYTVKADTLVTVEENSMGNKATSVAVRISTGSVDLATPNWASPDSKAAVNVEDATALLHQNTHASVKNDPEKNQHEFVVSTGAAEVQRGSERIELAQWEKASFATGGAIQKSNVLAPPSLVEPLNFTPIINENPKTSTVRFEWKPVQDAVSYKLRVSTTAMFRTLEKEAKISGTSMEISGLDAGDYFWNVTAVDSKKQTSEVSETFKFTMVAQGKSQEMVLHIDATQLHGRVAEIVGRTEPGSALIVNGQSVANIAADGTFRHFTEQLEPGEHTIVVVGQNRRGGTTKQQVSIVVPK